MKIREFKNDDEKAVISLWDKCGLIAPQNNPKADIDRKMFVDPDLFLVGIIEDKIIATVMGGYEGHRGWINYLAVDPENQKSGYAREIMGVIEAKLAEKRAPKINLQVRSSNKTVLEFYDRIGYTVDDVVSMGKRLVNDKNN